MRVFSFPFIRKKQEKKSTDCLKCCAICQRGTSCLGTHRTSLFDKRTRLPLHDIMKVSRTSDLRMCLMHHMSSVYVDAEHIGACSPSCGSKFEKKNPKNLRRSQNPKAANCCRPLKRLNNHYNQRSGTERSALVRRQTGAMAGPGRIEADGWQEGRRKRNFLSDDIVGFPAGDARRQPT